MSELRIELLRLQFENGTGHVHRIEPITRRAAAILAERLDERLARDPGAAPAGANQLEAAPVRVRLAGMSDDEVARGIASSWLAALAPAPGSRPDTGAAGMGGSWRR